ncbi:hypothetical protein ACOSQ4_032201 [Xanthoceras sorbifolium]
MEDEKATEKDLIILLGRPFKATLKIIIDVQNGKLSMTVLGETMKFQDEIEELLELERELEKKDNIDCNNHYPENAERPHLGSVGEKEGLEAGLGVDQNRQLEAEAKPCRDIPDRLNPNLKERVYEEEQKLLNVGTNYLFFDSKRMLKRLVGDANDCVLDVH